MPTMTVDIAELALITGENARLKKQVDDLQESNTRYLEEKRAARLALTDLAEAAALVIAQWDLDFGERRENDHRIWEDIERLRACLTTHMAVIEGGAGEEQVSERCPERFDSSDQASQCLGGVGHKPPHHNGTQSWHDPAPQPDMVNAPPHYTFSKVESIDAIEAWGLGFCLGNAVKYIARSAHKGSELEDLKKARWYLERAIKNLESK